MENLLQKVYYLNDQESYKTSLLHPTNPERIWRTHFTTNFGRIFALKNYTQQLADRCWEIGVEMNNLTTSKVKLEVAMELFNDWTGLHHVLTPTWTFWNSMFLAVTTYTTIGYGNVTAKSHLGKLAAMIYAVIGIPLVLMILHRLGHMFLAVTIYTTIGYGKLVTVRILLVLTTSEEPKYMSFMIQNDDEGSSEDKESPEQMEYYKYLIKRLKQSALADRASKQRVVPAIYEIPGPFEPLPARSYNGDYWPVFPFSNQYSGAMDLDPSISRHIGGDLNIPVPSWGMMDITGHFFNRISDTTTKFGYVNHPVNMLGLNKEDFATLVSDPRLHANRYIQPTIPLGKVPRSSVPLSCKPPMCNPYTGTFALGIEHDIGGHDGNEGDINIPFPVSKGVAYRFPFGGNYYYDLDNITITYGHNLSPLDPYSNPYMFNNAYSRRRELLPPEPNVFPRNKRNIIGFVPVVAEEVPLEVSKSTKVTSEDFQSSSRGPLRRLKRLMKRNAENQGIEIKKETNPQVNHKGSLFKALEGLLEHSEDGNSETRMIDGGYVIKKNTINQENDNNQETKRIKITMEKTIIPVEAFNPPYYPSPINQGYINPDNSYYPPIHFRQPIQTDFGQEDQFYGPPLNPRFSWMD